MSTIDPRALALNDYADVVLDALWERLTSAEAGLMGLHIEAAAGEPEALRMRAQQARTAMVTILRALGRDPEADFIQHETGSEGGHHAS